MEGKLILLQITELVKRLSNEDDLVMNKSMDMDTESKVPL